MWDHRNTWHVELRLGSYGSHDDGAAFESFDDSLGPRLKTRLIFVADNQVARPFLANDLHASLGNRGEVRTGHDFQTGSAQGAGHLGESSDYNGAGGSASKGVHIWIYA